MDPRHPEQVIYRVDQLVNQFKSVMSKISTATTSSSISQAEREGALVVQEICLVAPRLHEAMMQASMQKRHSMSRILVEKPVENYVAPNQAETVIVEPKPRKKKTTKKKKAE